MASLGHLSNAELRQKLGEYGYPVGPVTETTREVLLKKLKQLMVRVGKNNSSKSTVTRRNFNSSDESEDDLSCRSNLPEASFLGRLRRKTSPKKYFPKTPGRRPSRTDLTNLLHPSAVQREFASNTGSTPYIPVGVTRQENVYYGPNWRTTLNYYSNYLWDTVSRRFSRVAPIRDEFSDDDIDVVEWWERNSPGSQTSTSKPSERVSQTSSFLSRLSSMRFRQNSGSADGASGSVNTRVGHSCHSTSPPANTSERWFSGRSISTPFQSDFVKRLAGLSRNSPPAPHSTPPPSIYDVKENDESGVSSRNTSSAKRWWTRSSQPVGAHGFKTADEESKFGCNSHIISKILLLVAVLFFIFIAAMYVSVRSRDAVVYDRKDKTNNYSICNEDEQPSGNDICIYEQDLVPAIKLIKIIHPILIQKAVHSQCSGSPSAIMSHYEIVEFLMKTLKPKSGGAKLEHWFRSLKSLLIVNPRWGITVLDTSTGKTGEDRSHFSRLVSSGALVVTDPDLPFFCYLKLKLLGFLTLISVFIVGLVILFMVRRIIQWYVRRRERDKLDLFNLVEQIIEVLVRQHQMSPPGQPTYISINHVRDELIKPPDRKRLMPLWEKAVNYIDEFESRVRAEIRTIEGESCKVWRWLPHSVTRSNTASPTVQLDQAAPRRNNKMWQGQAFDTMSGSPNSLLCSPTPCLKIRHMFDPDMEFTEDWPVRIEDAVLEKCGEQGVRALHIYVDRSNKEGCVYLKCASQEDAGRAYQALHGWWFDSNLVTVKYLRLERYHERFPEAQNATARLQPSNNQRLSLQWQGTSENN